MNANSPASGSNNNRVAAPASHPATRTQPVLAPSHIALKDDAPGGQVDEKVLKGYALPAGAAYTRRGTGTFRILKGSQRRRPVPARCTATASTSRTASPAST